jgi:hypothetical protein
MVLDPVTAFALAGNVLQFLQVGSQFTTKAFAILRSGSNGLAELRELRQVTVELQLSLEQLKKPSKVVQAPPGSAYTATETRLSSLSIGCLGLAKELVTTLDKIGVNDKPRRMDTILKGFRAYYHTSAIDGLKTRLNTYRDQLAIALVVSMRSVAEHRNTNCAGPGDR